MFKRHFMVAVFAFLGAGPALAEPMVTLTGPANNARYVPPAAITLAASASDPTDSIARVDFYNGTTLIGTATSAPYSVIWTNVSTGSYTLTAKATNAHQFSKTSSALRVTVNTPPSITITSPVTGTSVAGLASMMIAANANDSDGSIAKVEFFHGGSLIGTATSPPYVAVWNNVSPGTYTLTARATDNLGGVTRSPGVAVTVTNPISVTMAAPANNTKLQPPATVNLLANAADSNGAITRVDFYAGSTQIGSANAAPFAFNWANVPTGKYTITARATDSQGLVKTSNASTVLINAPPSVNLTMPVSGASYVGPATVRLAADAVDRYGSISKVQFYRGGTLLGTVTSVPYTFTWSNAPPGTYAMTARATDNFGDIAVSTPITLNISNPVTVGISSPQNRARFLPPATVDLSAIANDTNGSIVKVDFYQGASLIGTATAAPYTIAWTNVPAGQYRITAKATDSGGISKTSTAISIVVDQSPNVALISPLNNAGLNAPASIPLSAAVSDSDGTIGRVQFFNGATLLATLTSPPYTYVWNNVTQGNYRLRAKATDNLGVTTTSVGVLVSVGAPIPPSVSLSVPANNAPYNAPAAIVLTANASASPGNGIAKVDFFNGAMQIGSASQAPYTINWTDVAPGSYTVTARATDSLGVEATSGGMTVSVNAPPVVGITMPASGALFGSQSNVSLQASASDPDGSVSTVEFYNGAVLIGTAMQAPYAITWPNVGSGSYAITARATDNLGAVTTSAPVEITVAPPPVVSFVAPANNIVFTAPSAVALTANASAGWVDGSISKVDFFAGATLIGTADQSPFTVSWTNVPPGTYVVAAVATDNIGGTATSLPVTVLVNPNSPPLVSLTATPGTASSPATIQLTATAADADGTVAQVDFYNGETLLATASSAPFTTTWLNAPIGSTVLTARATDNAGAMSISNPVTVTVTAPATRVFYIQADHLNTPRVITDENNIVVWTWDNSDPFGNNPPNTDPGNTGQQFEFNLRFPGQYFDKETNLHYNYYRDYDPSTGRYLQSDPIGLAAGINTYGYVGGNPSSRIDPMGLDICIVSPFGIACVRSPSPIPIEPGMPTGPKRTLPRISSPSNAAICAVSPLACAAIIANQSSQGDGKSCPPVPDGIVGDQGDPRAGQRGKRHTSGPMTPENGGTGDPWKDFDLLTGGTGRPVPSPNTYPPGTQQGDNGVTIRPGSPGEGPRIDIPGNDGKPPETLHY